MGRMGCKNASDKGSSLFVMAFDNSNVKPETPWWRRGDAIAREIDTSYTLHIHTHRGRDRERWTRKCDTGA